MNLNSGELLEICKTRNFLADILKVDRQLKQTEAELASVRQIVADSAEDAELKELALAEIAELEQQITRYTDKIEILLLPRDSYDDRNVFLEISTDGSRKYGSLVEDLARMY